MELEKVYQLFFKDIYTYIYSISKNKEIAEDITQDTFLKALKNLESFDDSKDIRAWLFTIARNTYYTFCKRQKIYVELKYAENLSGQQDDILENMVQQEQFMEVFKYLHQLKEPYKEVFMLRFFGEISYREIGEIFGKSEGWSRVTYYRAKKQILGKMEDQENENS